MLTFQASWELLTATIKEEKKSKSVLQMTYLSHHCLFVLFLLSDLYGWQFSNRRHQEIHQNVLAIWHLINQGLQTGWKVGGVQIVVISRREQDGDLAVIPNKITDRCRSRNRERLGTCDKWRPPSAPWSSRWSIWRCSPTAPCCCPRSGYVLDNQQYGQENSATRWRQSPPGSRTDRQSHRMLITNSFHYFMIWSLHFPWGSSCLTSVDESTVSSSRLSTASVGMVS